MNHTEYMKVMTGVPLWEGRGRGGKGEEREGGGEGRRRRGGKGEETEGRKGGGDE